MSTGQKNCGKNILENGYLAVRGEENLPPIADHYSREQPPIMNCSNHSISPVSRKSIRLDIHDMTSFTSYQTNHVPGKVAVQASKKEKRRKDR